MVRIQLHNCARVAYVALAFLIPILLAGCTASPATRNVFVWDLQRDGHAHATHVARETTIEERHVAAEKHEHRRPAWYSTASVVTPVPKPGDDTAEVQPADYETADAGSVRFAWPVEGHVISNFGESASGERNDGINIATERGTPIHAAAAGTVTYAGDELRSYGNLVLIKHDDGFVTAYAHAERLVVQRGDQVAQGQVIGYAGDTGDVTRPQLHFEIRHGVEAVNPRPLLVADR